MKRVVLVDLRKLIPTKHSFKIFLVIFCLLEHKKGLFSLIYQCVFFLGKSNFAKINSHEILYFKVVLAKEHENGKEYASKTIALHCNFMNLGSSRKFSHALFQYYFMHYIFRLSLFFLCFFKKSFFNKINELITFTPVSTNFFFSESSTEGTHH